jgi:hypothetical protein
VVPTPVEGTHVANGAQASAPTPQLAAERQDKRKPVTITRQPDLLAGE